MSNNLMTAMRNMSRYFISHNYGKCDYPTYSKDPEWQRLNDALIAAQNSKTDNERMNPHG